MSESWVTVATFSRPVEAHLARTKLESEGIECVVADEYLVRVNWLVSNAVGGVKLKVPSWVEWQAREILRPRPRLVVVADDAEEHADGEVCPACRSYDVYYHRFSRRAASVFRMVFGLIVPRLKRRWFCKRCGYAWKDGMNSRTREN